MRERRARMRLRQTTIERLPLYLRASDQLFLAGTQTVSSEQLAVLTGYSSDTVRRDLWDLAIPGRRGMGFDVLAVRGRIGDVIGTSSSWRLAIAGVGNLGRALSHYSNLSRRGLDVVALFDVDLAKVNIADSGIVILPFANIASESKRLGVQIGIITTPTSAAQGCANAFVAGGVKALLNFAPTTLEVPPGVYIRRVDVMLELQLLAYHLRSEEPTAGNNSPGRI